MNAIPESVGFLATACSHFYFDAKRKSYVLKTSCAASILAAALLVFSAIASAQYIYVANTGEDTVSKIDINSMTEVAVYSTWFTQGTNFVQHRTQGNTQSGPAPSRIALDSAGNVYVLNRFFNDANGRAHLPVLMKIAPTGGTPGTDTSNGRGMIMNITDTNTNNSIDPGEAKDVRILWAKEVGIPGTDEGAWGRALAIDTTGTLWVGLYNTMRYYKVNPATGDMLPNPGTPTVISTLPHTPYGAQVDMNGTLWSVDEKQGLVGINTSSNTLVQPAPPPIAGTDYSLSLYNDCSSLPPKVLVYVSEWGSSKTYVVYDPLTNVFTAAPLPTTPINEHFNSLVVGVDSHGDIFSGEYGGGQLQKGRMIKSRPDGTVVWDTDDVQSTVTSNNLHGLIVDSNDDVWAVHLADNRVVKYSGVDGTKLGEVKVGVMPYTYGNSPPPICNTAPTPPSCAVVTDKEIHCEPNGVYSYTFSVTNNSGKDVSQVLLTPIQGSNFTLAQQLYNLSTPLHDGQSTTLTVKIKNVKAGASACFFLSFAGKEHPCCVIKVCPTLPTCGSDKTPAPKGR